MYMYAAQSIHVQKYVHVHIQNIKLVHVHVQAGPCPVYYSERGRHYVGNDVVDESR